VDHPKGQHGPLKLTQLSELLCPIAPDLARFPAMYGLGLRAALSALLGLGSRRRAPMRPAHGLAAHRRLAALHTAALALGLTARRYSAETGGVGFVCHRQPAFNVAVNDYFLYMLAETE
jgi:hypothetical protein